ncbi:hypothetical protein yc1106_07663 [Curvularia clavata]|uniref:Heterokaryon incompatibility domain-containing protein n=1 Tax=Curvularia clavata TaxID=95742 RepID=A0A9Q8ZFB2_CURCL|nr:hypothetical protein yc1106_07663 [Curvularia clavata]
MTESLDTSCETKDDDLYDHAQEGDVLWDNSVENNELMPSGINSAGNKADVSKPHCQREPVKMRNDLRDTPIALGSGVFAEIAEISKYKFTREKAKRWAKRDICFLIYDDSDAKVNGFDSDDEDAQEEYALQMSLGNNGAPIPEKDKAQCSDHANDSEKNKCRVCAWYPEFPHKWKPRKFRLVNPTVDHPAWFGKGDATIAAMDMCMHYVAVSYCWPPRDDKPIPRSYTVRDLDGRVRASRALDDVLDRAVDFANSCGFRMIWIDQECLPQPTETSTKADWEMQELGIQSMDIVYNRAMYTVGLLDVKITSQEQLNAIKTLLHSNWEATPTIEKLQYCTHILRFLHETCQDRWYTRAWVIQEAICAGLKLFLAFRCDSGLSFSSKFGYERKGETDSRPYHSLDDHARGLDSKLFCISVSQFWRILDVMHNILLRDFSVIGSMLVSSNYMPADPWPGARSVLQAAESLHPRTVKANTLQQDLEMYSENYYGKRPTINAAGALTLLKHRECYFESDRLAIIANMCDYDFRLDTKAVSNKVHSLRLAILALTLNNGDLSLLAPEAYLPPNEVYSGDAYAEHTSSSLLFQSFFMEAPRIEHCHVRNFITTKLQTIRPGQTTPDGVLLKAYPWSVNREIDFTLIKLTWADAWESLRCWEFIIERQKDETWEQYRTRNDTITHWMSQTGVYERALEDFRQFGCIPENSAIWGSVDHRSVQVTRYINSRRINQVPEMQNLLAQIIFDILRYTLTVSEEKALARGLATSIWQSVRTDQVPGSDDPLPDEVSDALFSHIDVLKRPFATLQLEETLDNTFAQLWFVDRIMETGRLWCGTYIPPDGKDGTAPHISSGSESTTEINSGVGNEFGKLPAEKSDSIIYKQIRRQCLAQLVQATPKADELTDMRWPTGTLVEVLSNRDYWSTRGEERRKETLFSTFDVDGPCMVATPYNAEWEILPRPKLRSTRVCWIVEERNCSEEATIGTSETEDTPSDTLFDTPHANRPNVVERKGKERATNLVREPEAPENDGASDTTEPFRSQSLNLRVLQKVRGLWQIMDLPQQDYVFS